MTEAKEYLRMDEHQLFLALGRFIDDNKYSNSLPSRWLADRLIPLRETLKKLKADGVRAMNAADQESVAAFRLAEIEAEQRKLSIEQERLDNEARRIRQARPDAA